MEVGEEPGRWSDSSRGTGRRQGDAKRALRVDLHQDWPESSAEARLEECGGWGLHRFIFPTPVLSSSPIPPIP